MPSIIPSSSNSSPKHSKIYQFINCRLVRGGRIIKDDFWIRGGKILNPEPVFYEERVQADVRIDCHDALICPGFLDIQINGGFGYDFSSDIDNLEEGVSKVAKGVLSAGVTSIAPTVVTSPSSVYHQVIPQLEKRAGGPEGAGILGIHLEGPFISPEKKGAHPPQFIQKLEEGISKIYDVYGCLDNVGMVTIAPELPGATAVISHLANQGIVVSVGHSNGNLEDGEAAVNCGASFITHLFNAMLPFHHRDPGLVGLLTSRLISKPVHYGIIADGIHTHPAALRIAHRTHPQGLVLVTDAMAAMGLSDGEHHIGQMKVMVEKNCARLVGTNTLAGSIVTMDYCVRQFVQDAGVSLVEGIEAASLHPARVMGIEHLKGSLDFGTDADFLLVSDKGPMKVLHTFIADFRCRQRDHHPAGCTSPETACCASDAPPGHVPCSTSLEMPSSKAQMPHVNASAHYLKPQMHFGQHYKLRYWFPMPSLGGFKGHPATHRHLSVSLRQSNIKFDHYNPSGPEPTSSKK